MKLTELKRGESSKIVKIGNIGELKQRLTALGIGRGETIKLERNAPLGDPQEYIVRDTAIAIRKEDAEFIEIENIRGDVN
ncbi:MAG: ferrous iron transport protein A [Fusobacteria bacterium]|jgi:Fe2+ transport system protein FeoA|nr:ferrous iron transport protein A [Fusobacteriota bacterium]